MMSWVATVEVLPMMSFIILDFYSIRGKSIKRFYNKFHVSEDLLSSILALGVQ